MERPELPLYPQYRTPAWFEYVLDRELFERHVEALKKDTAHHPSACGLMQLLLAQTTAGKRRDGDPPPVLSDRCKQLFAMAAHVLDKVEVPLDEVESVIPLGMQRMLVEQVPDVVCEGQAYSVILSRWILRAWLKGVEGSWITGSFAGVGEDLGKKRRKKRKSTVIARYFSESEDERDDDDDDIGDEEMEEAGDNVEMGGGAELGRTASAREDEEAERAEAVKLDNAVDWAVHVLSSLVERGGASSVLSADMLRYIRSEVGEVLFVKEQFHEAIEHLSAACKDGDGKGDAKWRERVNALLAASRGCVSLFNAEFEGDDSASRLMRRVEMARASMPLQSGEASLVEVLRDALQDAAGGCSVARGIGVVERKRVMSVARGTEDEERVWCVCCVWEAILPEPPLLWVGQGCGRVEREYTFLVECAEAALGSLRGPRRQHARTSLKRAVRSVMLGCTDSSALDRYRKSDVFLREVVVVERRTAAANGELGASIELGPLEERAKLQWLPADPRRLRREAKTLFANDPEGLVWKLCEGSVPPSEALSTAMEQLQSGGPVLSGSLLVCFVGLLLRASETSEVRAALRKYCAAVAGQARNMGEDRAADATLCMFACTLLSLFESCFAVDGAGERIPFTRAHHHTLMAVIRNATKPSSEPGSIVWSSNPRATSIVQYLVPPTPSGAGGGGSAAEALISGVLALVVASVDQQHRVVVPHPTAPELRAPDAELFGWCYVEFMRIFGRGEGGSILGSAPAAPEVLGSVVPMLLEASRARLSLHDPALCDTATTARQHFMHAQIAYECGAFRECVQCSLRGLGMSSGGFTEHFLVASRAPEALSLGHSTLYVPKCCNEASVLYLALALRECGAHAAAVIVCQLLPSRLTSIPFSIVQMYGVQFDASWYQYIWELPLLEILVHTCTAARCTENVEALVRYIARALGLNTLTPSTAFDHQQRAE